MGRDEDDGDEEEGKYEDDYGEVESVRTGWRMGRENVVGVDKLFAVVIDEEHAGRREDAN